MFIAMKKFLIAVAAVLAGVFAEANTMLPDSVTVRGKIRGFVADSIVAAAQGLTGDWTGRLDLGGGRGLKLVLHVSADAVTMDSPDQGAFAMKCEAAYVGEDSLSLRIPTLMMSYEGRLRDNLLEGTFRQAGVALPLTFERGAKKANRPQAPQPPFPYVEQPLRIENPAGGSVLTGTLTVPAGSTRATAVAVLVSGSGAQNRDEEIFEHKPFAVIADYLARRGIATFRYDDRGVGESTGSVADATTADFAADARAVVDSLRAMRRFGRVGVIGHSEGGQIACILAAQSGAPDFIVSIAGPSIIGREILEYQNKVALMAAGMTEGQAAAQAVAATKSVEGNPPNKWLEYFLRYDPSADMSRIECPALIVYGAKDRQVPASLNEAPARRLAPKAIVKTYPGLNHLMQTAPTGAIAEYATIEETISPVLLADITDFITSIAPD